MKQHTRLLAAGMLASALAPATTLAYVNLVSFEGVVETVGSGIAGDFTAGQSISGHFLYETTTAADPISNASMAWYDAISLDFRIGAYDGGDALPVMPSDAIVITNDAGGDRFSIESNSVDGDDVAGLAPAKFRFQLNDPGESVYSDVSLPADLSLADFDTTNTSLSFITLTFGTAPGTDNQVRGRVTAVTVTAPRMLAAFTGEVVSVGTGVSSGFAVGESISGKFTFDPSVAPHPISGADQAWYDAIALRYRIGTYRGGDDTPLAASDGLFVKNDVSGSDTFAIGSGSPLGPMVAGLAPDSFRFQLTDPTASVFGDVTQPTALDLADFDTANTSLTYVTLTFGSSPGTTNQVRGAITSLSLEPVGDADGDGVMDDVDNCQFVFNPGQRDTNGDGFGNRCDADLDDDCTVGFSDLALMKSAFFGTAPTPDLDGDGVVSFSDMAILKTSFFSPPGPSCARNICE